MKLQLVCSTYRHNNPISIGTGCHENEQRKLEVVRTSKQNLFACGVVFWTNYLLVFVEFGSNQKPRYVCCYWLLIKQLPLHW